MANLLRDLQVTEISLVDRPANSTVDRKTGKKTPRAVVALYKRDWKAFEAEEAPVIKQRKTQAQLDAECDRLMRQPTVLSPADRKAFEAEQARLHEARVDAAMVKLAKLAEAEFGDDSRSRSGVGGFGDVAVPVFEPDQQTGNKRKRNKMKFRDVKAMVAKGEAGRNTQLAVWEALFDKAEKDVKGQGRQAVEARVGKLLEEDFKEGGHLCEHLAKYDRRMSLNAYEAMSKRDSPSQLPAEDRINKRLAAITKSADFGTSFTQQAQNSKALARLLEMDPQMYGEYERQRREHIAKAALNPALDGSNVKFPRGDEDDQDAEREKARRKARRKALRAKCNKGAMEDSIAGEDEDSPGMMDHYADEDEDDDDLDDDEAGDDDQDDPEARGSIREREKRRVRAGVRVGKALESGYLVTIRKANGTIKLCQRCASENPLSATKCGECGKRF